MVSVRISDRSSAVVFRVSALIRSRIVLPEIVCLSAFKIIYRQTDKQNLNKLILYTQKTQTDRQTDRQTNRQTQTKLQHVPPKHGQTDRQTDRHTDKAPKYTGRYADRQTDRQTDKTPTS